VWEGQGYAAPCSFEDRSGLPPSAPEKTESVERSVDGLMQLVEEVDGLLVEKSSQGKTPT